jgi:hypothetical protein
MVLKTEKVESKQLRERKIQKEWKGCTYNDIHLLLSLLYWLLNWRSFRTADDEEGEPLYRGEANEVIQALVPQ